MSVAYEGCNLHACSCLPVSVLQSAIDRTQMRTFRNEVQRDKVLHNGGIVAVNEVRDGLNHAVLDVVPNAGHEPEVEDGQPTIWCAHQVARVGVGLRALCVTLLTLV